VFHYYAHLSGVFGQETYHDNEDFTQKTIFVLVSESSLLMAPDIALIMVLMGAGCRGVQCSAIKDRERRSIGVYPVQPDGSRPRENVFTIYENKRICPKQSKFVDEQSSGMLDITGGL
jgi:hypothetical protein